MEANFITLVCLFFHRFFAELQEDDSEMLPSHGNFSLLLHDLCLLNLESNLIIFLIINKNYIYFFFFALEWYFLFSFKYV